MLRAEDRDGPTRDPAQEALLHRGRVSAAVARAYQRPRASPAAIYDLVAALPVTQVAYGEGAGAWVGNPAADRGGMGKVRAWKDGRIGGATPVGCFPGGHGPYETWDQTGNVWEWCLDWFHPEAYPLYLGERERKRILGR